MSLGSRESPPARCRETEGEAMTRLRQASAPASSSHGLPSTTSVPAAARGCCKRPSPTDRRATQPSRSVSLGTSYEARETAHATRGTYIKADTSCATATSRSTRRGVEEVPPPAALASA